MAAALWCMNFAGDRKNADETGQCREQRAHTVVFTCKHPHRAGLKPHPQPASHSVSIRRSRSLETKMEQANWQRNRGKKLKFSIGIRELVLVLFGFVAGVGLAEPIIDHIRETTQRKPFNDGTTTQPNTENEDSQGFRSPIAPEENLICSPIRVRPTDQEGSEAGQQTPASTNMDSDPGTSGLPSGSNHTETPDYNGVTSFRDFVGPGTGNPACFALAVQPNMARRRVWNAPIDGRRIQIPNERPNEPEGVQVQDPVQGDGGNRLTENGRNFYDVLHVVASSLNSDRWLMIFTVMILLTFLALAYLEYRVAMAYFRTLAG